MANPFPSGSKEALEWALSHPESAPVEPAAQPAPAAIDLGGKMAVQAAPRAAVPMAPEGPPDVVAAMGLPSAASMPTVPSTPQTGVVGKTDGRVMVGGQSSGAPEPPKAPLPEPGYRPGTPGRLVRGGRTPQSWQVSQKAGLDLPPELLSRMDQADKDLDAAAAMATDAERRKADITNEFKQQQAQTQMLAQEQAKQRQALRDAQIDDAQAKYEKASQIDPEAWWTNKSGIEKILAAIAVGVGAFVQGRTGQPNAVLDQINKEIERDVQRQIGAMNKAGKDIQDFYAQYDREDQKIAAGEAVRLDQALVHLDDMLSGVTDQATAAQGMQLRAKLEQESIDRKIKLAGLTQGEKMVQRHDVMTPDRVVGGSPGGYDWSQTLAAMRAAGADLEQVRKDVENLQKTGGLSRDQAMFAVSQAYGVAGIPAAEAKAQKGPGSPETFVADAFGGSGGFAGDPDTARKKSEQYRAYKAIQENLQRMKELREKSFSSFGDTARQYDALANDVLALYAVANGQGALSEGDRETMGKILGMSANNTFTFTGKAQLAEAENIIDRRLRGLDAGITRGQQRIEGGQVRGTLTGVQGPRVDARTVATRKPGGK